MSTTPVDLLGEARALLVDTAKEVRCRTVISRAYYAAFHACWKFALALGFQDRRDRSAHGLLIRFLADREEDSYREGALLLNRLRDLRNKADYHLDVTVTNAIAKDAVEDAAELVEGIVAETA